MAENTENIIVSEEDGAAAESTVDQDLETLKKSAMEGSEKLQKVLADAGVGSRRAMEGYIEEGRVRVNGRLATLGLRVRPDDVIEVDGAPVTRPTAEERVPRVLIYNKPEGEIVSMKDPEGRPSVFDNLPPIKGGRWIAVGRLDFNTEGLLIFTSSGALANLLMHPRYAIEREYMVRVGGELTQEQGDSLVNGVELEDGPAAFSHISDQGGTGVNHWYLVRLSEGRNREVRRMFEAVGLTVNRLIRVRFGDIDLPRGLHRGEKTELNRAWVQDWILHLQKTQQAAPERTFTRSHSKKVVAESRSSGPASRGGRRPQKPSRPRKERLDNYRGHGGRMGHGDRM